MSRFNTIYSGLVLLLISACSNSLEEEGRHFFNKIEEDGIEVAVTSDVPYFASPLFEYEEILRLQEDEDQPESLLFRPSIFYLGDDGRYYVEDNGNHRIAIFGSDGVYNHAIGREGEGPGEFRTSPDILWIAEGQIFVFDRSLRRTTLFSFDGTLINTYSSPVSASSSGVYPIDSDRFLILTATSEGGINENRVTTSVALIVSVEGDTLCSLTTPGYTNSKMMFLPDINMGLQIIQPLAERAGFFYRFDQRIMSYHTGKPDLLWYDTRGQLVRKVTMDIEHAPVSDPERVAIIGRLDRRITDADNDRRRAMTRATREGTVIPEYKPYWMSVQVDEYGFLWLERVYDSTIPTSERGPATYMILSPEGEYLGDNVHPHTRGNVSRGHFLAITTDPETDKIDLVVYRMIPVPGGFSYH